MTTRRLAGKVYKHPDLYKNFIISHFGYLLLNRYLKETGFTRTKHKNALMILTKLSKRWDRAGFDDKSNIRHLCFKKEGIVGLTRHKGGNYKPRSS